MLGFGHPWRGTERAALLAGIPQTFLAPEMVFGVAPSPGSDVAGATLFFHGFQRLGEIPKEVAAGLAGQASGELAELVVAPDEQRARAAAGGSILARFRADFERVIEGARAARRAKELRKDILEVLALPRRAAADAPVRRLDRSALRARRRAARRSRSSVEAPCGRIVLALAVARRDTPGKAAVRVGVTCFRAGWPEETPGKSRPRRTASTSAVAQLRSMGAARRARSPRHGLRSLDPAVRLSWT